VPPALLLAYVPVVIAVSSLFLLVLAALARQRCLALIAAALVLTNANWSSVNALTGEAGVGTAALLIGIVSLLLIACFRLNLLTLPRALIRGPGIPVFVMVNYLAFLSPVLSIDPLSSVRTSLSFVLVCSAGWCIFGKVLAKRPDLARTYVYRLMYAAAVNGLIILIAAAVLMGPSARRLAIGGAESRIALGGFTVSRLQAEGFNATGLGMLAASTLFVIVHWHRVGRRKPLKGTVLVILAAITGGLFLWTGGRSAILAFVGTASCLMLLMSVSRPRTVLVALVLLGGASICLYLLRDFWLGIFWRGPLRAETSRSLVGLFLHSRVESSLLALKHYGGNTLFGNGTGILARSDFNVECFFFRVLIELGIVGGTLYILTFAYLTYCVIRVDLHHLRLGQAGAWLPSSAFVFTWFISPASYGFSLFTGNLVLQLAIAAGAAIEWEAIRKNKISVPRPGSLTG